MMLISRQPLKTKNGCERTKNRMQTKLQPLGMDHLFIYFCFFFVGGVGRGGGGGLGNYPKKFLYRKSREKKSCTVGEGKKIEQAFLLVGSC